MKNIVICCDGTGNQLKETYSNVVKLYMCLEKDTSRQLAFYDPGVGTMSDPNVVTPLSKWFSKLGGLTFGWGLKGNVEDAYKFLMEYYSTGDQIYIFGFSRGAYTARVLAGMIHSVGLLVRGSGHLFPYAFKTYRGRTNKKGSLIATQFKKIYSRDVKVQCVGLWDTVTSVGLFGLRTYPYTTTNPSIEKLRHAISIDERRAYYRQNLFCPSPQQDVKQVWFAGVHSDVGGSYPLDESGLAQVSLWWMLKQFKGLCIDEQALQELFSDSTGGENRGDACGKIHRSLTLWWYPLEIFFRFRWRFPWIRWPNFGRRRNMHTDCRGQVTVPVVHASVEERLEKVKDYRSSNLVKPYTIEPY